MTPSVSAVLVVEGLHKHFGGVAAVDSCSFRAPKGQVTGLIGPNGAGKSTAVDLISGFKLPDAGTIFFEGVAIQGLPPHRISRLGLIRTFQTPREWPGLTVLENVLLARWDPERETLWRSLIGPGRAQRSTLESELGRAREILAELGLDKLSNERAGNLSGGQKRIVEFARIRMAKPRLVILDEPMGGVNPVLGERIVAAIEGFIASGTSVIIVEHNLPFIERVAQYVIVMSHGSVIAAGPFESLRSNQSVIDAYLGEVAGEVFMSNEACDVQRSGTYRRLWGSVHHRPGQPDSTPWCDHGHRGTERSRQVHAAESGGRAYPAYGGQGVRRGKGGHRPADGEARPARDRLRPPG